MILYETERYGYQEFHCLFSKLCQYIYMDSTIRTASPKLPSEMGNSSVYKYRENTSLRRNTEKYFYSLSTNSMVNLCKKMISNNVHGDRIRGFTTRLYSMALNSYRETNTLQFNHGGLLKEETFNS